MADLNTDIRYIKGVGEAGPRLLKSWAFPLWAT